MARDIQVVPLDVTKISDVELGMCLQDIGEQFPISGDNYNLAILEEAIRRLKQFEEDSNR